MNQLESQHIVDAVNRWLVHVVVGENICPFAKPVVDQHSIKYSLDDSCDMENALIHLSEQWRVLDAQNSIETTLVIYPKGFSDFDDFLDLIYLANEWLVQQDYECIYQLAHFHPHYCFDGLENNDPANYTNRAPFPILHIIREESIEQALTSVKSPQNIPERNIRHARKLGVDFFRPFVELNGSE